jgi:hypothetical protein
LWYFKFVCDFIYKYINLSKIYFTEDKTDSLYYTISGNPDEYCHQGFKYVIKDDVFYKENMYKPFSNPISTKEEQTRDKKKLVGFTFGKEGYMMFEIETKC